MKVFVQITAFIMLIIFTMITLLPPMQMKRKAGNELAVEWVEELPLDDDRAPGPQLPGGQMNEEDKKEKLLSYSLKAPRVFNHFPHFIVHDEMEGQLYALVHSPPPEV